MNNYIIPLILSLSIICNTDSLILRYIIKTTLVITHNLLPHPTQLLKFRLSPMIVYEMVWFRTLDMESWANFTHMNAWNTITSHLCYIFMTRHPLIYTQCVLFTCIACFSFFHSCLFVLLSLHYYCICPSLN